MLLLPENSHAEWSKPVPLRKDSSMLPDFPTNCLPPILKCMALGVAESTSTDPSMTATALLSAMSHCFSGVYRMYGKQDHSEPLTLYSLVLANPAERKSPVMRFVRSPFIAVGSDYNETHRQEIYLSEENYKILEKEIEAMQASKDVTAEEIAEKRAALDGMQKNNFKRVCVDDVTPEALARLLKDNGTMLMISDEAGVFKNFGGRYSNGTPNIDLLLKSWGGETFMKDRCNSELLSLEKPYLSICLCGQPYILDELMQSKVFLSSGLVARFLYCYPKSLVGQRKYETNPLDKRVTESYRNLVYAAMNFKFSYKENEEIKLFFCEESQKMFADYYNKSIEPVLLTDFAECTDWGGKYHGLILRLCGIIHCIKCVSDSVAPESRKVDTYTLGQAVDIAAYYKEQARFAYGSSGSDALNTAAEYILKKLRANNITEISGRDILHLCRKFKTMDELVQPIERLVECGYLRKKQTVEGTSGRKPPILYEVNPLSI